MNPAKSSPEQEPPTGTSMGWPEVIVGASVAVTLLFVLWIYLFSPLSSAMLRVQRTVDLNNMKQLQLATSQMALDGIATRDASLGWPGDTGGTFTNWAAHLVPEYLTTNDFRMLIRRVVGQPALGNSNNSILVYAVGSNSPANTVFLSSVNFTNTPEGGVVTNRLPRLAFNGFAIVRKDGSGQVLGGQLAGDTNAVGAYAPLCR